MVCGVKLLEDVCEVDFYGVFVDVECMCDYFVCVVYVDELYDLCLLW